MRIKKKLEKQKIENEEIIEKSRFGINKEVEINDLKNKSNLAQK